MTKIVKPLYLLNIPLDASLAIPCVEESALRIPEPAPYQPYDWMNPPEAMNQVPNPPMDSFRQAIHDFMERYRPV